jgi:hypothetical protein
MKKRVFTLLLTLLSMIPVDRAEAVPIMTLLSQNYIASGTICNFDLSQCAARVPFKPVRHH